MNGWLARRSAWQFALIYGSAIFLISFLTEEVIPWPGTSHHRIALRYALTTGLILAVVNAALATYKQQGQRPGDPDDPEP
jgi:hypothetical protein